jgi:hypothetical protein
MANALFVFKSHGALLRFCHSKVILGISPCVRLVTGYISSNKSNTLWGCILVAVGLMMASIRRACFPVKPSITLQQIKASRVGGSGVVQGLTG